MCDENIIEREYIVKDRDEEFKVKVFYDKDRENKLVKISDEKYRKFFEENNFLSKFRYIGAKEKIGDVEFRLNAEYNGYLMSETYDLEYLIEFEDDSLSLVSHFPPVYDYDVGCEVLYQIVDGEKFEFELEDKVLKHYFSSLSDFKAFLSSLDLGESRVFDDTGFYFKVSFESRREFYPV